MNGFVDPRDPLAVETVLTAAFQVLGPAAVLAQLSSVLPVVLGREGGVFRQETPTRIQVGDEALAVPVRGRPVLEHVVGGIVLSHDEIAPLAVPGVLAAFVVRALSETGAYDDASVLLTSLRDAVQAAG